MFKWIRRISGNTTPPSPSVAAPTHSASGDDLKDQDHARLDRDEIESTEPEAYLGKALFFVQSGEIARSIQHLLEGVQLFPKRWDFHFFLGNLYFETRNFSEAIKRYRNAIDLQPEAVEVFANLGLALRENKQIDDAIESLQIAVTLNPGFPGLQNNLGALYVSKKNYVDATACFEAARHQQPDAIDVLKNLAFAYFSQGVFPDAIACLKRAVSLDPTQDTLYVGIGELQMANAEFENAYAQFHRAVAIAPQSNAARANRGSAHILFGDLQAAWVDFRCVMRMSDHASEDAGHPPLWLNDSDIKGSSIRIYADEGLGDAIQYVRYIDQVRALGAEVFLEVQPALKSLLETAPPAQAIFATGELVPRTDYIVPVSGLPVAFDTDVASIPSKIPYIHADPGKIDAWSGKLKMYSRPRIGLVWSGNPLFKNDGIRSAHLENLLPLIGDERFQFLSLQKDVRDIDSAILASHPTLVDMGPQLTDFAETAAIIANLDLVISVDTSVAHLTGAMGKPIWIMLPFSPDRRWMLETSKSPWYPTARLFRQRTANDWHGLAEVIKTELTQEFVSRLA